MRILLALLLTWGLLVSTIKTVDGEMRLYRDQNTCVLVWEGAMVQVVDLGTCES